MLVQNQILIKLVVFVAVQKPYLSHQIIELVNRIKVTKDTKVTP